MNTKTSRPELMGDNAIIRYSLQLAMLSRLLSNELITRTEYEKVRSKLMEKFSVISEIWIQSIPLNSVQSNMVDTHNEVRDNETS